MSSDRIPGARPALPGLLLARLAPALMASALCFAPNAQAAQGILTTGQFLSTNQVLQSVSVVSFMAMQGDGHLCIYAGMGPSSSVQNLWCSGATGPIGDYYATIQGDGNLCVYKGTDPAHNKGGLWCNYSNGAVGKYSLRLEDDGRLGVFHDEAPTEASTPVWQTPPPPLNPTLLRYFSGMGRTKPVGTAAVYRGSTPSQDRNWPADQGCAAATYTVPAGAHLVQVTATGGSGLAGVGASFLDTLGAMAGHNIPGEVDLKGGGRGGSGATVSAYYAVTPGQTLYITPGVNGYDGNRAGTTMDTYASYPGGGAGYHPGGSLSMVSLAAPTRQGGNLCTATAPNLLVLAGGGGGGGSAGTAGSGGGGGNAGLPGGQGGGGQNGSGSLSGGGGGPGSQTGGGVVGSHPGCGSELRAGGGYGYGGLTHGYGGGGGSGYYGGGAGGEGDCFLNTGAAGGGGGSSYLNPAALLVNAAVDNTSSPAVTIQAINW
jgi:hypothetical protein